eukprot:SAG22_NODE_17480_length_304_cov_0.731707_1_plen_21_part_10
MKFVAVVCVTSTPFIVLAVRI